MYLIEKINEKMADVVDMKLDNNLATVLVTHMKNK